MGIVYRARQSQPVRVVALKMMLPYLATSEPMRARFRIESDAVARLDHPGILPIYEVGEHNGLPYFSMKFAEGGSLARRMSTLAGQWREIAAIVAKLARAVQHAHESGILHRDLKPGNILFDARDEPMVADFGLAKFRAVNQNMTLPFAVLGSPNYIATGTDFINDGSDWTGNRRLQPRRDPLRAPDRSAANTGPGPGCNAADGVGRNSGLGCPLQSSDSARPRRDLSAVASRKYRAAVMRQRPRSPKT